MNIEIELNLLTNPIGGKMSNNARRDIYRYYTYPSKENWDRIAHMVIDTRLTTIFTAVMEVDPTFPATERKLDADGNIIFDWPKLPTPETLTKALRHVAFNLGGRNGTNY